MPKRPPTPPPGDDEPRYLTICFPYPPHANMENPREVVALARWLACCMGNYHDLYAIFHKPSASNMVLIEVNRNYPHIRRLLGAHKWSKFVHNPGLYHDEVTRIYFSTMANVRAVEKTGWKRIFIDDAWFRDFIFNNQYIKHPYPPTSYCEPPSEDQTGFKLCRPIPRTLFDIQAPPPPPIPVGSSTWTANKESDGTFVYPSQRYHAATSLSGLEAGRFNLPGMFSSHVASSVGSTSIDFTAYDPSINWAEDFSEDSDTLSSSMSPISSAMDQATSSHHTNLSSLEDDFGTLSINPALIPAMTDEPLCNTHHIVCKLQICSDYRKQLKQIERRKERLAASRGGMRGRGPQAVNHTLGRGRGRDNAGPSAKRGGGGGRGRGVKRGSTQVTTGRTTAPDNSATSTRGQKLSPLASRGTRRH